MKQTFQVQGMTCGHCVRAVTEAVRAVDATAKVEVDLGKGQVDIDSDQPREAVAAAIAAEGYAVLP